MRVNADLILYFHMANYYTLHNTINLPIQQKMLYTILKNNLFFLLLELHMYITTNLHIIRLLNLYNVLYMV